jgi:hypothetical protein
MSRLETIDRKLADAVASSPGDVLHRILRSAASVAFANTSLSDELSAAVAAAVSGNLRFGDETRSELSRLQEECDDAYLSELDGVESGEQLSIQAKLLFRRARALSAILAATQRQDADGVAEVVYEAIFSATDEAAAIKAIWAVVS